MFFYIFLCALIPMLSDGRVKPLDRPIEEAAVVPLKNDSSRWLTLEETEALKRNTTTLTQEEFEALKSAIREKKPVEQILLKAYQRSHSLIPLYLELAYQQAPWFLILALLYLFPGLLPLNLLLHTLLLLMRTLILERPPVASMAETLLFVPWVAALLGLIFNERKVGSYAAFLVLGTLFFTFKTVHLETVQPVLNSSFWLTIHVLLVVGSYGAFLIASLLGHRMLIQRTDNASSLLKTLYVGTFLLIAGTLLGGVWAAESWGRFWDWDPKESWAFISSCVYLLLIHAFRFKKIDARGLSFGAIIGFLFISFTWYGVNYLLGVGLHSYGFGSGGALYYALFLLAELLFLLERRRVVE